MSKHLCAVALVIATFSAGCDESIGDYIATSLISRNGFAVDGDELRRMSGETIRLWGFVDHRNIFGSDEARAILEEWWSGEGPSATSWQFNLKAREDDEAGRSFAVRTPNDPGRDELLRAFVADARAGVPTKVLLEGRLFTFDAPSNFGSRTGLYIQLESSRDVRLAPVRAR